MSKIYLRKVAAKGQGWCHDKNETECFFYDEKKYEFCPESVRKICIEYPIIFLKITRTEYNKLKKAKEKKHAKTT